MPEELRNIFHTFEKLGYKCTYSRTPEDEDCVDIFTERGGYHFCTLCYMGYGYYSLADCRRMEYAYNLTYANIVQLVPLLKNIYMSGGWD